jgi:hypothetical protein
LARLAASRALYAVVFGIGFAAVFIPVAAVKWSPPSPSDLYREERWAEVVALVDARAASQQPATAEELLLAGHACFKLRRLDDMVGDYQAARHLRRSIGDDGMRENLLFALKDPHVGRDAALLLAEMHGDSQDTLTPLRRALTSTDATVRANALAAVARRVADPALLAPIRLSVARADIKPGNPCEVVRGGLDEVKSLTDDTSVLADRVLALETMAEVGAVRGRLREADFTCINEALIRTAEKAIAGTIPAAPIRPR